MYQDLTKGSITKGLLLFAAPMVAGNLIQQLYNIADTLIVGLGLLGYTLIRCRELLPRRSDIRWDSGILKEILDLSLLTCA